MCRPIDYAVTGAYITQGYLDVAPEGWFEEEDGGHIGAMASVCRYVEYIIELIHTGAMSVGYYPGVFEYEVAEPFGMWFRNSIDARFGIHPAPDMVRVYLINSVQAFFKQIQDLTDDEIELLDSALLAVQFKGEPH